MSFGKRGLAPSTAAADPGRPAAGTAQSRARSTVPTPVPVSLGAFAKWRRLPAALIDNVLSFALPVFVCAMIDTMAGGGFLNGVQAAGLASLVSLAYFAGFESSERQATPGKRMMGVIVTDADGAPISLIRALVRNSFGRALSMFSPFYLGYSCVLFTSEARAVHDFVAGTRVRRARSIEDVAVAFV